jgi:cytochrome c6
MHFERLRYDAVVFERTDQEDSMSINLNTPKVVWSAVIFASLLGLTPLWCRADDAAALYKTKCAACHGADGKGETSIGKANKIRDLGSAEVQKQNDEALKEIITKGKDKMPAYGKSLKPEQISALAAFVRSFAK